MKFFNCVNKNVEKKRKIGSKFKQFEEYLNRCFSGWWVGEDGTIHFNLFISS